MSKTLVINEFLAGELVKIMIETVKEFLEMVVETQEKYKAYAIKSAEIEIEEPAEKGPEPEHYWEFDE